MRDVYRNVKFYEELDDLENLVKQGIQRDSKIIELTDKQMTNIGKSRGESPREISEKNRMVKGAIKSNREYGGKAIDLGGVKRIPSKYDNFGKTEMSFTRKTHQTVKEKSVNLKKIAVAASLTLVLAGGLAYTGTITKLQEESYERANEIVSVVDAGDYYPQLEGVELIEHGNGHYSFKSEDGDTFNQYGDGEYAITADEAGELVEQINQSKQR